MLIVTTWLTCLQKLYDAINLWNGPAGPYETSVNFTGVDNILTFLWFLFSRKSETNNVPEFHPIFRLMAPMQTDIRPWRSWVGKRNSVWLARDRQNRLTMIDDWQRILASNCHERKWSLWTAKRIHRYMGLSVCWGVWGTPAHPPPCPSGERLSLLNFENWNRKLKIENPTQ